MNDNLEIINNFAKKNSKCNLWGTHMPYIFYSENNELKLLFSIYVKGYWKLHLFDFTTKEIIRLPGLDNTIEINECNPCIYINKNHEYVLQYLKAPNAGGRQSIIGIGKDLTNLKWSVYNDVTFSAKNYTYDFYSVDYKGNTIFIKNTLTNKINTLILKYGILARITPLMFDDTKILISTYPNNLKVKITTTYLINLKTNEIKVLKLLNNDDPYKASINTLTGDVYYTFRKSNDFEDREIKLTNQWKFVDPTFSVIDFNNDYDK